MERNLKKILDVLNICVYKIVFDEI